MTISPKAWLEKGSFWTYKSNYKVFYQDEGKGEVLLLLHGFPTASWDWAKMWPSVVKDYRCIAADFIGFGFSDKPVNYNYSIMDQADLIEQLLHDLNIESVYVLSHDFGDTVLQELLARYYDRIEQGVKGVVINKIAMLNGGILQGSHRPRLIQSLLNSPLGFMLTPFLTRAMLKRNFDAIFGKNTQPTSEDIDHFYYLMDYNNGQKVFHKLIRYMTERVTHMKRWTDIFINPTVPIKLINGAADPISGIHVIKKYEELYGPVDKVILQDIGHYPQHEAPDQVLHAIDGYFEQ